MKRALLVCAAAVGLLSAAPAMAEVHLGISVGIPLLIGPPIAVAAPQPVYYPPMYEPPVRYGIPRPVLIVPPPAVQPAWYGRYEYGQREGRGHGHHHEDDDDDD